MPSPVDPADTEKLAGADPHSAPYPPVPTVPALVPSFIGFGDPRKGTRGNAVQLTSAPVAGSVPHLCE